MKGRFKYIDWTRCHAKKYHPTKSQKKVAKKVKNFLEHGRRVSEPKPAPDFEFEPAQDSEPSKVPENSEVSSKRELSVDKEELRVLGQKKAKIRRLERRMGKKINIVEQEKTIKNKG